MNWTSFHARNWSRVLVPAAVFMLALALRLGFLAWRGPTIAPDTREYLILARNLMEHAVFSMETSPPYTPSIYRAPLYPSFLALLQWCGLNAPIAVASVNAFIDAGVAVAILLLAKAVVPPRWAAGSAVTYVVYPGAVFASSTLLSETLFTALLVGSACLLAVGLQKDRLPLVAMAGVGLGFATLCRSIALLLPWAILVLLPFARKVRRPGRMAVALVGGAVLVVSPWAIRSSVLAHRFVPVQAMSGAVFYIPTRVDWDQRSERVALGLFRLDPIGQQYVASRTPEEMANADRVAGTQAVKNILSNPFGYFVSRVKTLPLLLLTSFDVVTGFNESFVAVIAGRDLLRLVIKLCLLIFFSLIPILLAAVGLKGAIRHPNAWVCAVFWVYILVIHIPVYVVNRYWWPAVPFMLVSAAIGAALLEDLWRRASSCA